MNRRSRPRFSKHKFAPLRSHHELTRWDHHHVGACVAIGGTVPGSVCAQVFLMPLDTKVAEANASVLRGKIKSTYGIRCSLSSDVFTRIAKPYGIIERLPMLIRRAIISSIHCPAGMTFVPGFCRRIRRYVCHWSSHSHHHILPKVPHQGLR